MTDIPIIMTQSGAQPTAPADLHAAIIAEAVAMVPGLTANLPAGLIEDMAGTATAAVVQIDQSRVDLINSLTPYGANLFLLNQIGQLTGVQQIQGSNSSAYVVFSGTPGFVIAAGFLLSDGTNQYTVIDGGVIAGGGSSQPLYCVSTQPGTFAIPANTITQIGTSFPATISLSVTNPTAGTPGTGAEDEASYRAAVLNSQTVTAQGTFDFLKTLLRALPNVNTRLISIQQDTGTGKAKVFCDGADPILTAYAIYKALPDINMLEGSSTSGRNRSASINDFPDTYVVQWIAPPQQAVTMTVTWNTPLTSVSASAVQQLAAPAIQSYINSLGVGNPINLLQLNDAFVTSVSSLLSPYQITKLSFSVSINGTPTSPTTGTEIIPSESESYFYAALTGISVVQG